MRYRGTLAYDGTGYYGYQRQADVPTIQGEVERALEHIAGRPVTVLGAGRTDTGVHASGQVVAFDLAWRHAPDALCRALNANLPQDIAFQQVHEAAPGFHPRYDALSRTYVYRLYTARVRDPLRQQMWLVRGELGLDAVLEASHALLGWHDFSTFGKPPQGDNPVRQVIRADWAYEPDRGYCFTITANAFLYRMVRSITGTLVEVGLGRMTPAEFRGILAACERSLAAPPAPPHGLTLVSVAY